VLTMRACHGRASAPVCSYAAGPDGDPGPRRALAAAIRLRSRPEADLGPVVAHRMLDRTAAERSERLSHNSPEGLQSCPGNSAVTASTYVPRSSLACCTPLNTIMPHIITRGNV
jgi:hypothetical protein